jgi:hypothetical protein
MRVVCIVWFNLWKKEEIFTLTGNGKVFPGRTDGRQKSKVVGMQHVSVFTACLGMHRPTSFAYFT